MDKQDKVLEEARTRFDAAVDAENINRQAAISDIRFANIPGEQWEADQKRRRSNRPCYEFNKIRQHIRLVTGGQRQNPPAIKVRPVDGNTDPELAETITGLIRNIESVSNAEWAYDTAYEFATTGGFGVWRVATEYCDDTGFEQEIRIKEIRNPFAVHFDPTATEWDCRDAQYAFVSEMVPKEEFKRLYPKHEPNDWESALGDQKANWLEDDAVRVCEYWRKTPAKKRILLMSDGAVVEAEQVEAVLDELAMNGITVVRERTVDTFKVEMFMVAGGEVLSGPHAWAGKYIPIVPVWGDRINIEGTERYSGLVRFAKDAQRTYNYERTTSIEAVSLVPKAPYVVTAKMVEGWQQFWDNANTENYAYLPYNPDPAQPGGPRREPGPQVPTALMNLAQMSSEDIKSATGQFDPSRGQGEGDQSGRAILALQNQGNLSTFSYIDNLGRALKYTGEILVDLIPKVYDTERTVRILGEDGAEDYAVLNQTVIDQQTGQPVIVNDIAKSKFDVVVTIGPSFQSQRMETAEAMLQLSQSNTPDSMIARYLALKSLDIPQSDELLDAMRRMLVQQGLLEPAEGEQAPQPPPPDPEKMAKAQKLAAEAERIEAENQERQTLGPHKIAAEVERTEAETARIVAETAGMVVENLIRQGVLRDPNAEVQVRTNL